MLPWLLVSQLVNFVLLVLLLPLMFCFRLLMMLLFLDWKLSEKKNSFKMRGVLASNVIRKCQGKFHAWTFSAKDFKFSLFTTRFDKTLLIISKAFLTSVQLKIWSKKTCETITRESMQKRVFFNILYSLAIHYDTIKIAAARANKLEVFFNAIPFMKPISSINPSPPKMKTTKHHPTEKKKSFNFFN